MVEKSKNCSFTCSFSIPFAPWCCVSSRMKSFICKRFYIVFPFIQRSCILRRSLNIPSEHRLHSTVEEVVPDHPQTDTSWAYWWMLPGCFVGRNHCHSTYQCEKSYRGADGCAERTTRSPGLPASIALYCDRRDALLMERASHSPLPVQLLTVFLSHWTRHPASFKRDDFSDVFEVCKL